MKFSIIVPIYQEEQYITRLLDSLKNQTYQNYEVILVNDESTDNTVSIITPYLKDTHYRLFTKKHGGIASARNFGLNYVTGQYVLFIDSDDYVEDDFLEQLNTAAIDNPGIDIIKYQLDFIELTGKPIEKIFDTAFSKLPTKEAFRIVTQGKFCESSVLYAYRMEFLKEKKLQFQDGKSECDFGFVPLALIYAKNIMSLSYRGYHFVKRNRNHHINESEKTERKVYDTLFQFDFMKKRVTEDETLDDNLKKMFLDYIAYAVILKGTILPNESVPAYVLELNKRNVVDLLIANTLSKIFTKMTIKKDMESFIKKQRSK